MKGSTSARRPWVAGVLALVVPGLGHLYGGAPGRALAWFGAEVVSLLAAGLVLVNWNAAPTNVGVALALAVGIPIAAVADAIRTARQDRPRRWFDRWFVWAPIVAISILVSAPLRESLRARVLATYYVSSNGMSPGVMRGDFIVVSPSAYRLEERRRWQVVAHRPVGNIGGLLLRRVAAFGGETVEIRSKTLFVDGKRIDDPFANHTDPEVFMPGDREMSQRDNFPPLRVPPGTLFLLGDNRDNSLDSRFKGPVPVGDVVGRVRRVYWSRDPDAKRVRWNRIGIAVS